MRWSAWLSCLCWCGMACAEAGAVEVWACRDEKNVPFDLLLWPDGTVVSTWIHGDQGAAGERGLWQRSGKDTLILFDDGWSDLLHEDRRGLVTHRGFAPGRPIDRDSGNQLPATRLDGLVAHAVGVWIFPVHPGPGSRHVAVRSDGAVFGSDDSTGLWVQVPGGIRCEWASGAIDLLKLDRDRPILRSWSAGVATTASRAATATPLRVGAGGLKIVP